MAKGYTLDELNKMDTSAKGYTLDELNTMESNPLDGFANAAKPKTSFGQKVLNAGTAVTNFLGGKAVQETFGAEIAKAKATPQEKQFITQPSIKETAGSALQLGANFIPGAGAGTTLATKVGVGAATGYAFDVGSKLQQDKPIKDAIKPGTGTVVGATIPVIGAVLGKAFSKVPDKLEEINMRLTPVEKQNIAKQGKNITDFVAKKKLVGTPAQRYAKIKGLYDDMENTIQKKVNASKAVYNKADILEEIKNIPEKFADEPAGYDEAVSATNKVLKFVQEKSPEQIPAKLLNTYKRNIFNRAYAKNNVDVVNETYQAIGSLFKSKLDKSIKPLEKLNKEYGNLIVARKILYKATSRNQAGLFGKAAGLIGGSSLGGSLAGPGGAAVGAFVGPQVVNTVSTPIRSVVGAGVQSIDDVINKLPTDKLGNLQIGKKALLDLIMSSREKSQ